MKILKIIITLLLIINLSAFSQGLKCDQPSISEYNLKDIYNTTFVDLISYATAKNYIGEMEVLKAKLNYPGFPNLPNPTKIPTICLFHGGGFRGEDTKNSPIMILLQDYFYKKGFLVVTADYRQNWEGSPGFCGNGTLEAFEDAQYRAFQDSRALVRYLKAKSNTLGVDTNAIFLLGTSAGGINIVNLLAKEHSLETPERIARLGKLDGIGNDFNYSTKVAGLITAAAATVDLSNIQLNIPLLMIHGSCDDAVPFGEGRLIDCPNLSYMYGSYLINETMKENGFESELHTFCGFGHNIGSQADDPNGTKPSFIYWTKVSSDFIFKILCGQNQTFEDKIANDYFSASPTDSCTNFQFYQLCNKGSEIKEFKIGVFPSYIFTFDRTAIKVIADVASDISYEIYDLFGKIKSNGSFKAIVGYNEVRIDLSNLGAGPHIVLFYKNNQKVSSQKIMVRSPLYQY